MRVAVLSLTRDRLDYTKHCFQKLAENAGCDYDHYVFDQGSRDGTAQWLVSQNGRFKEIRLSHENVGISRAMNTLLDMAVGYDVYVKFDNDCELTTSDTLRTTCEVVDSIPKWILSPRILGLNSPPEIGEVGRVHGFPVGTVGQIGGIFMAVPGWVFKEFRYDETGNPKWGMDDVQLSQWFRNRNGKLGYLLDYPANHYETTEGQKVKYPSYWERKKQEMGIA